jgi:hypothetical protein
MFQTAVSLNDLDSELTSLIYTFECDISIENNIITIVKVGKTSRTLKERLLGYKELNIKNIHWIQVESINKVERELLEYLNKDLKLRIAKGKEFFYSDIETVKNAILYIINNQTIDPVNDQSDTEFQCENCLKFFKNKSGLSTHSRTCKTKENIICNFCNNRFSTKNYLNQHYSSCKLKEIEDLRTQFQNQHLNDIEKLKTIYETRIKDLEDQHKSINSKAETRIRDLEAEVKSKNEQIILLKEITKYYKYQHSKQ